MSENNRKEIIKENKKKRKEYKEYKAFLYSSFIEFIIGTYLIAFILSLNEEMPLFNLKNFLVGFVIATVVNVIFWLLRRLSLGYKAMVELDMRGVYNLERRKSAFWKDYNNKLLSSAYFSEGDFFKAISLCDEMICSTKNKKTVLFARHTKILSLFFSEGTQNIKELIREQRELKATVKSKDFEFMFRTYQFIEVYLDGNYEKALETVTSFFDAEKESIVNSRKIIFMQFQKMLCLKNGDEEGVKNCNSEILKCDSERRTFFSKIIDS